MMSRAQIEARINALRDEAEEHRFLMDVLYLLDEGFIEIDAAGGLWETQGAQQL